jgi:hypothetical protein
MSRKTHLVTFVAVAGVLVLWSTRAASRYTGDTTGEPGAGLDACTAKLAYEAAVAVAKDADTQYKKLAEPDWSKLSYQKGDPGDAWTRNEKNLADFLHNLKAELAAARQRVAAAGNPNPEQAEKNYLAAKARFEALEKKHQANDNKINALAREIQTAMRDIQKIDTKLAAASPPPSSQQKQRTAQIEKYRATIASTQTKIQSLTGTDDMDEARKRVADLKYKKFSNDDITRLQRLWDETPPASPEFKAIDGRLETAIEEARQDAGKTLAEYSAASRALSKLESEGDNSDRTNSSRVNDDRSDNSAELRNQKAAKQKLIGNKTTQKAQLGLQGPSLAEVDTAFKKMNAADAQRALATEARDLARDLKVVEPWIEAYIVRNATEGRLQNAKREYYEGVKLKDSRLNEVRAQFNALQSWVTNQRDGLKGRDQDEQYWQTVSGIKSRAGSEYAEMEASLSSLDCFSDVANLLSDIRARRKNVASIRIGKGIRKPAPPKKASPRVASGSNLAGWWVWLRGSDRVPMILEKNEKGEFRGVYFPGITTQNIERGKGPTVHIGFAPIGGNKFRYRYKYPGSGSRGGRGGGTMVLNGNRMTGPWADDQGGAKGTWTLERATAGESALLKSRIGNRG